LTPEEWAVFMASKEPIREGGYLPQIHDIWPADPNLGYAAQLLYGHPQGFTWDDVRVLQKQIIRAGPEYGDNPQLYSLIERISVLLPPREESK
jgi:hypothetical protein